MGLDSVIFILFLLIHLVVGIRASKHSTIQHTHFATPHIIAAILAITYGGEVLCNPLNIDCLVLLAGSTVSYFIIGNLLAHRLHLFLNNRSVAEIMGRFYGNVIRKIVAICGLLHSIAVVAIQFKMLSMAISWFFAIQPDYSLFIAALLVMFSVGLTTIQPLVLIRIVRCASFGILLPIIAWILWKSMVDQYNVDQVNLALAIKDSWNSLTDGHSGLLNYMIYFIIFSIPAFYPAQVVPMLISENATQIKRSFNGSGFFSLSINLLLLWVALLVEKNSGQPVIAAIPLTIFDAYLGLKGVLIISVTALTISTAGANLHAATGLMTNDLPDLFRWVKKPIIHLTIIGVMAILLALYTKYQIIWIAILLFKTVVSLPLLLSLMGISLHRYTVLVGMLAGGITTILWFCFVSNAGFNSLIPAIGMNLLSIIVVQFFKGKHIPDQHDSTNSLPQEAFPKPPLLWKGLAKYITFHKIKQFNFFDYLQKQLPKDNLPYVLFSFYILLTGYGSFYTFSTNPIWHPILEMFILFPSLLVATFFLVYTFSAQSYVRKIASIIWPLSHIYFLFLVGTSMAILSKFSHLHDIIFIINLFLALFITPLRVILFGSILTVIVISMLLHCMDSNLRLIDCFLHLNINIAYLIFMLFILVGGFLYHNNNLGKLLSIIQALTSEKEEQNARQFFNKQQVEALAYESSYIISQLNHSLARLEESDQRLLAYSTQTIRLNKYFNSIFEHLKHNLHLVTNWISMDQLLAECFDAIKISNIYDTPYVVINTKHLYMQCAIESIKNLIISSLYSCSAYQSLHSHQKKDIYIYIDDTQLGYRLTLLQGKLQKINAIRFVITTAIRLPIIRPTYKVAEMADIQILGETEEKIDLENQHIVHAHYGYYERFSSESEITQVYVIPVNVKEITKAFATLSPVVHTQKMVLDPISIKEEAAFLEQVKKKAGLDVALIMDALQLIKVYYTTQRRKTGELFYLHPMAVASILLTITQDNNVIIAGLVHDVVQNTPLTEAGLTTLFGAPITQIVSAAARLEKELPDQTDDYTAYIEFIIGDTNHGAILVRLADVLHNARTISGHTIEKQIEKARLIQKFYLPLAIQIQLADITRELQLHSEKILNIAMGKD